MRIKKNITLGVLLLLVSVPCVYFLKFGYGKNASTFDPELNAPSPELVVGQLFVVGIPGPSLDKNTKEFLGIIKPGGIVLYKNNIDSFNQLKNLIIVLQKFAVVTTGRKYFIMVDEEPGGAGRLNLFKNVFSTGEPNWETIEKDIYVMQTLGINVDLAPVSDFPFDNDSFIKRRMPAHTTDALVKFNKQFISALENRGIGSTLKHFPGMGVFKKDPHLGIVETEASEEILNQSLYIFSNGIKHGASFVMTGHGIYNELDADIPATLSKKIVGKLRKDLSFKGIIITDDISDMPLVTNKSISIPEAALQASKAGHDMLIFSRKENITLEAHKYLIQAYNLGGEFKKTADFSYKLIVSYKDSHDLNQ